MAIFSGARAESHPEPSYTLRNNELISIGHSFAKIRSKTHEICIQLSQYLSLNYHFRQISWKNFPTFGGGGGSALRTRALRYRLSIIPYFPHSETNFGLSENVKNFQEIWHYLEFSRYFFNFLLILLQIFEKLPQIIGICPIENFRLSP